MKDAARWLWMLGVVTSLASAASMALVLLGASEASAVVILVGATAVVSMVIAGALI